MSKYDWEARYRGGNNSGDGSYGRSGQFKSDTMNRIVREHGIKSVVDIGCGDGEQIKDFAVESYHGFDVAPTAIDWCRQRYVNRPGFRFDMAGSVPVEESDLVMSLDVLFHLVDENEYHQYIRSLFGHSEYVLVSTRVIGNGLIGTHVIHRDDVAEINRLVKDYTIVDIDLFDDGDLGLFLWKRKTCPTLTVILNMWRRPQHLVRQLNLVRSQSMPPDRVWLWVNGDPANDKFDASSFGFDRVIRCGPNIGIYGRFALALLAETDYIAILDDDIMPGQHWFVNALRASDKNNATCGCVGRLVDDTGFGWGGCPCDTLVDWVQQSWFFRSEWAKLLWREKPYSLKNGEDMHFGIMAKKHAGIDSMVPKQAWSLSGSLDPHLGTDAVAVYKQPDHEDIRSSLIRHWMSNGWKPR